MCSQTGIKLCDALALDRSIDHTVARAEVEQGRISQPERNMQDRPVCLHLPDV